MSGHFVLGDDARTPVEADMMTWARAHGAAHDPARPKGPHGDPIPRAGDGWARVAKDVIGDSSVSTVFLGLDHGFRGKPILFETLVMGGPCDQDGDRYSTWAEAEEGHARFLLKVRAAQGAQEFA